MAPNLARVSHDTSRFLFDLSHHKGIHKYTCRIHLSYPKHRSTADRVGAHSGLAGPGRAGLSAKQSCCLGNNPSSHFQSIGDTALEFSPRSTNKRNSIQADGGTKTGVGNRFICGLSMFRNGTNRTFFPSCRQIEQSFIVSFNAFMQGMSGKKPNTIGASGQSAQQVCGAGSDWMPTDYSLSNQTSFTTSKNQKYVSSFFQKHKQPLLNRWQNQTRC